MRMRREATTIVTTPPTDELHVFHYPSHSVVVQLTMVDDTSWRAMCGQHEHTRTGEHMIRMTHLFGTLEEAEAFVSKTKRVGVLDGETRVTVLRHRADPTGPILAVKIDADNDTNGNPRRGWLIYTTAGRFLGFVDEGYRGSAALTVVGDVVELCTLAVTPRTYRNHHGQPYPQAA